MELARHVQNTQSTSIVMQSIQMFYGGPVMFAVTCCYWSLPRCSYSFYQKCTWKNVAKTFLGAASGSLHHLMHAIACTQASTHITSLMHVKNSTCHFIYDTYCLGHWAKENERIKSSNLIVCGFSLTFVYLLLSWILYLHVWLQNIRKFFVWSEYYNWFSIISH